MKLVENAIEVWRHYSTGALLAVGAIQGVWAATPSIDGSTASFFQAHLVRAD